MVADSTYVFVVWGVDQTKVFHRIKDCPAITGRRGWLGYLKRIRRGNAWVTKRGLRECGRCYR